MTNYTSTAISCLMSVLNDSMQYVESRLESASTLLHFAAEQMTGDIVPVSDIEKVLIEISNEEMNTGKERVTASKLILGFESLARRNCQEEKAG